MTAWQKFKSKKAAYCNFKHNAKGRKVSYNDVRRACKRYVESEVKKAKKGTKTATRKIAYARAKKVLVQSCPI